MTRIIFCLFLIIFLGVSIYYTSSSEVKAYDTTRVVTICALIDKQSPMVSKEIIKKSIDQASSDYSSNVNIEFILKETKETSLNPLLPDDLVKDFRKECNADIVMVFTNRLSYLSISNISAEMYGLADPKYGVIWIYNIESRLTIHNCQGNAQMTVEHELAHLFGAIHTPPVEGSFMSDSVCYSNWPYKLKEVIIKNKAKTWIPLN